MHLLQRMLLLRGQLGRADVSRTSSIDELQACQFSVQSVFGQQLCMRALGDDAALVHHHDAVGLEHGGQAVGDDQRGATRHQPFQCLLHAVFALCIQRAGGLIQQQDRRILQQRAGNRHTLLLATGKTGTALTQLAVIALRQRAQESIGLGGDVKVKVSPVPYASAIPLAFVSRWISVALYAAVALTWLVPDRRLEPLITARAAEPG